MLAAGRLPELDLLALRFAPTLAAVPTVTVVLPAAIAYDALLGTSLAETAA